MQESSENDSGRRFSRLSRRSFIGAGAATAAVAASSGLLGSTSAQAATKAGAAGTSGTGLKVGAGKAVFTPASLLPIDSFTAVHDDLYARVLLVESGSTRIAMVALDLTSCSEEVCTDIRTAITAAAGVAATDIMITVTHNFSSPHVMPSTSSAQEAAWVKLIVAGATGAVADAVKNLQDAQVGYGGGNADVNVNRNVDTAQGWWLGVNEQGPSDHGVRVTRFNDTAGNPIAVLVNYNVQSCVMQDSVMDDGTLPITADLAGAAIEHLEGQYPGAIGFWLVGATGDQFPGYRSKFYTIDKNRDWTYGTDLHTAGFALLTAQGERLGNEIVRVTQAISKYDSSPRVRLVNDSITTTQVTGEMLTGPVKSGTWTPTGTAQVPIWVFQIGNGVFAGVEPELSTVTADDIRKASPFASTFVMGMFEGGAKNMPAKWDFEHFTYEAFDGFYIEGTAEKAASRIERIIRSLR